MKKILLILFASAFILSAKSQTVTTVAASNIAQTTVTLNATGASLDAGKTYRVVFYYDDISGGFGNDISSNTISGVTSGSFTANVIGLSENTTYYFTAYLYEFSTPPPNWSYKNAGSELSFTTLSTTTPTVTTGTSITGITTSVANCNSNSVTADGGAAISDYGICWNTTGAPTTADNYYSSGTAGAIPISYNANATSLSAGTTYYLRAYATNSVGTAYSATTRQFITNTVTPTISPASGITDVSFYANWAAVTGAQKYFLDVSTASDFGSFVLENSDVGSVVTYQVTGLSANTTYYYRVRAFNDGGTDGADFTSTSSSSTTVTTLVAAPTTQASHLKWETIGLDISFNWIQGNGDGTMLIMRDGGAVTNPTGGTTYTANSAFGSGADIGSGTYVVYNATHGAKATASVIVTNITDNHTYSVKLLEYSGSGSSINYNTTEAPGFDVGNTVSTGLPISLLSFNASEQDGNVLINWETATELNNDYFLIERSVDGENFTPIAKKQGTGNSNVIQKYNYIDKEAPRNTVVYYRLHQYDFDGKDEIFPSVSITLEETNIGIETMSLLDNNLIVNYINPNGVNTVIQLIDINGKSLQMAISSAVGQQNVNFDLLGLSHGVYIISFEQENTKVTRKFIY